MKGSLLTRQSYDRRQAAKMQVGPRQSVRGSPYYPLYLLRADGTVMFRTLERYWKAEDLKSLATYLRVPLERA